MLASAAHYVVCRQHTYVLFFVVRDVLVFARLVDVVFDRGVFCSHGGLVVLADDASILSRGNIVLGVTRWIEVLVLIVGIAVWGASYTTNHDFLLFSIGVCIVGQDSDHTYFAQCTVLLMIIIVAQAWIAIGVSLFEGNEILSKVLLILEALAQLIVLELSKQ